MCWGGSVGFQGGPCPTAVVRGVYEQINAAHYLTCGVQDGGTPGCGGSNSQGQASPPPALFTAVRGGTVHSCGIQEDDTLACWGSDSLNRCDHPEGEFASLDVNQLHSCAITLDGLIECWGHPADGKTVPASCAP